MIDTLKATSTFGKVAFWNWNLAPQTHDNLTADFLFTPEQWGAGVVVDKDLKQAGSAHFDGKQSQNAAQMANLLLGTNEPDISGSCAGDMFPMCRAPCETEGDCPVARLSQPQGDQRAEPNSKGECNCWQHSHATGAGFWPLEGCAANQPLPKMWEDPQCVATVMKNWKQTAKLAHAKGFKYFTTPLVAKNLDYAQSFIEHACGCREGRCSCQDASCGCPVYVGFHFYAYDCLPKGPSGYEMLQQHLDTVAHIMEKYTFVKGAIINEFGMLNCAPGKPFCVPGSGKYPAKQQKDHTCPVTEDLPNGISSFINGFMDYIIRAQTSDGRKVVKSVTWFNSNQHGGVYNLRLFDDDGGLNEAGEAYISACRRWRGR
eukprot:s108_g5.t1